MSTQYTQDQATQKLAADIYAPAFWGEFAAAGMQLNDVERAQMVKLSAQLAAAGYEPPAPAEKTAGENPFLSQLIGQLDNHLTEQYRPATIKVAADRAVRENPELLAAALALRNPQPAAAA